MGVRKNYRNLTVAERDRFVQALHHVKATGLVDQFAEIHERHFLHGIHVSSHFLPWHREILLRFERALQGHHPDVTIPYWDSTVDRSPSDPLWNNNFLGQFNSAWGLRRALGAGGPLPTPQQVETNQRRDNYDTFWPELEDPIHNWPHTWVGGVMDSFPSPGDPVFYLHHCWIDLLWARWQLTHLGAPFVSSGAGLGLNDPLMEWPDRTPADVLDHHALGYTYDTEVPPAQPWQAAFQANTGNLWVVGTLDNRGDTQLGMMAGTSPSIAMMPDGNWQAAFQANTGNLWVVGTLDNRGDMQLGMMAGTSPSIAMMSDGNWQAAFQANTGNLWVVGTLDNRGDTQLGLGAHTSPIIAMAR